MSRGEKEGKKKKRGEKGKKMKRQSCQGRLQSLSHWSPFQGKSDDNRNKTSLSRQWQYQCNKYRHLVPAINW